MDFVKGYTGQEGFVILVGLILVIAGLAFFIFKIRQKSSLIKTILFIMLFIIGIGLIWHIPIPEEKIHILEYGLLGRLTTRDLMKGNRYVGASLAGARKRQLAGRIFTAGFFCMTVGMLDEIFQGILPYRFFQWSDVILNTLGAVWGVGLFLLS